MELKDLEGEHFLDAVDFSDVQVKTWGDKFENCQVMRFRLDGNVYTVTEDPDDGYRSSMRDISIGDHPMTNTFVMQKVVGIYRTTGKYGDVKDILELIDGVTGRVVVEVGTDNSDDYYPSFVANFDPTAMVINNV